MRGTVLVWGSCAKFEAVEVHHGPFDEPCYVSKSKALRELVRGRPNAVTFLWGSFTRARGPEERDDARHWHSVSSISCLDLNRAWLVGYVHVYADQSVPGGDGLGQQQQNGCV